MSTTPEAMAAAERSNGIASYLKVLYAPSEAFATLARVPTWGWAAIIGMVLTVVASAIGIPAILHLIQVGQQKALEQLPADQAEAQRQVLAKVPQLVYVVVTICQGLLVPWILWLIAAVVFAVGAALGGGEARFKAAWVAAVNLYIIGALGALLTYIIIALRGTANISSAADMYALPSLAMLFQGSLKLKAFLYGFNVLNLWYYFVAVIALEHMMKMSRAAAIVTVIVLAVLGAGLGATFAR